MLMEQAVNASIVIYLHEYNLYDFPFAGIPKTTNKVENIVNFFDPENCTHCFRIRSDHCGCWLFLCAYFLSLAMEHIM